MLACILAGVIAFKVLFSLEIGLSEGGEGGGTGCVCKFVLVFKFSICCVWSASGAPSWIYGSGAPRKRLDYKPITADPKLRVSSHCVVVTGTAMNAASQLREQSEQRAKA